MVISPLELLAAFVLAFIGGVICAKCNDGRRVVMTHA